MRKVLFQSVDEFLGELSREVRKPHLGIHGNYVRRTIRRRFHDYRVRVSLIAGYTQDDSLTMLEFDIGDCYHDDKENLGKLIAVAEHNRDLIDRVCNEFKLDVRSGLIVLTRTAEACG